MTERNPEHTRHYDRTLNGVTVNVWARPKSCFFCEHCTDIFVDLDGSPYLWFCELEKDIDDGMYERCENFKDDNFDMRGDTE